MAIEFTPERTALVMIDLMPRIVARATTPHSGRDVLERCVALAAAVRAAGGLVIQVRVERPGVDEQPPGSEFAVELDPQPGDVQLVKRSIGAFATTELEAILRAHAVDTIVLCGIATNFGVESTGRVADDLGFRVVYVSDAMTGLDDGAHEFAVGYVFPRFGEVATSADVEVSIRG